MGAPGRLAALEMLKDVNGGARVKADVVVIGGGPNGLAAAALPGKGGQKLLVLERRDIVGGAAVTEEFHPGFQASSVAHAAGPLRADRRRAGSRAPRARVLEPEPRVFAPVARRPRPLLFGDPARPPQRSAASREGRGRAIPSSTLAGAARRALDAPRLTPPDIDALRPGRCLFPMAGLAGRCGASAAWTARTCCAGDRWRSPTSSPSGSRRRSCARSSRRAASAARSPALVGRHHRAVLLLQAAAGDGNGAGSTVLVGRPRRADGRAGGRGRGAAAPTIRTGAEVEPISSEGRPRSQASC